MKKLFAALLLCSPFAGMAQLDPIGQFNRTMAENWAANYQRVGNYKVRGTPFLFGEPLPGKLKYNGLAMGANDKILYDLNDQLVGPEADGQIFQSDQILEEFILDLPEKFGGESLLFKNGSKYGQKGGRSFYNVMAEGSSIHLLKAYKVKVVPDPSNMMDKEIRLFEQYVEYYLYDPSHDQMNKVKLNTKSVLDGLKMNQDAQKKAAAQNPKIEKERDLLLLVESLNQ